MTLTIAAAELRRIVTAVEKSVAKEARIDTPRNRARVGPADDAIHALGEDLTAPC
jgi:hypothetical protein